MAKESLDVMMARLADGIPSHHWIKTSVGLINTRNESKMAAAARKIAENRKRKEDGS